MKILDAKSLHSGIDGLNNKLKSQMEQLHQLKNVVEEFADLDDAFKGKGGEAIRGFYRDWHVPLLSFYYNTLKNYEKVLTKVKEATEELDSDQNGFIRQSFLNGELINGMNKIKVLTTDLVDEANSTMGQVNDIVYVQRLEDNQFYQLINQADKKINKTIEDLNTFDTSQTNELNSVEQDIQLMNQYINEIQSMFQSGELSIESYNTNQLNEKPNYSKLEKELKDNNDSNPFTPVNDLGKYAITAQSFIGAALVLGDQVQFRRKEGDKTGKKAVIHTAKWIKGEGNSKVFKKLARNLDKSIRNPGAIMKTVKGLDGFIEKITRAQILGISKANSFQHLVKNVVVGVDKGKSGIQLSQIPKMIAKRVYPIDAAFNIGEEAWNLGVEIKNGDLDNKDVPVALSNVAIKTGATAAGAIIVGTLGAAIGGPAGAAVGAFVGGTSGAWIGDAIAGFSEDVIRKGPSEAIEETGEKMSNGVKKGFKWVKGVFK